MTTSKLKLWTMGACVAGAALSAAWAPAAMAATPADAAHSHDAATPGKLALNAGRKWSTDAPLRAGMGRIRDLADATVARTHAGRMDAAAYAVVAGQVEQEIAGIVANCKLEPRADAMLHLVVADLGAATAGMAGKTPGAKPEQGVVQLARAVNDYGRHFQHPGFKPVHIGH
jgi:hypothetical protein